MKCSYASLIWMNTLMPSQENMVLRSVIVAVMYHPAIIYALDDSRNFSYSWCKMIRKLLTSQAWTAHISYIIMEVLLKHKSSVWRKGKTCLGSKTWSKYCLLLFIQLRIMPDDMQSTIRNEEQTTNKERTTNTRPSNHQLREIKRHFRKVVLVEAARWRRY